MKSECLVTPASKEMYLSQLVHKLFKAINPEDTTNSVKQSRVQAITAVSFIRYRYVIVVLIKVLIK